jgi:hypothetical protein
MLRSVSAGEAARDQGGSDRLGSTPCGEWAGYPRGNCGCARHGPDRCKGGNSTTLINTNKE